MSLSIKEYLVEAASHLLNSLEVFFPEISGV